MLFICRFPLLLQLLLLQRFSRLIAQQCTSEESILGMMLQRHIFTVMKPSNSLQCLQTCNGDVRCQSFNYDFSNDICELNNHTKEDKPEDFIPNFTRYYFGKARKKGLLLLIGVNVLFLVIGLYIFQKFSVKDGWEGGEGGGLHYEDPSKGNFILNFNFLKEAQYGVSFYCFNTVFTFFRDYSISNYFVMNVSLSIAPLGSIPELPAESCKEIKASEGQQVVSDWYWIHSAKQGKAVLAYCDMETEGEVVNWEIKLVQQIHSSVYS